MQVSSKFICNTPCKITQRNSKHFDLIQGTDYIKFKVYSCSNPSLIHVLNKKDRDLCLLVRFSRWWISNLILFKTKVEKSLLKGQSCFNELNRRIVRFYKLPSFFLCIEHNLISASSFTSFHLIYLTTGETHQKF